MIREKIETGWSGDGRVSSNQLTMLVQGTPVMPNAVQNGERIAGGRVQATEVVHSIKGYLAWYQDQYPEMDMT